MERELLLARISQSWIFGEETYPALEVLNDSQAQVFALTHVLKHQSKGASWCIAMRKGTAIPSLSETRDRLLKIMVNSLRFQSLIDAQSPEIDRVFEWWGCIGSSRCDIETLNRVRYGETFRNCLQGFAEAILAANGLLEKSDHGVPLPFNELQEVSGRILTESAHMLHIFGVTRKAFEEWVATPNTLVELAH